MGDDENCMTAHEMAFAAANERIGELEDELKAKLAELDLMVRSRCSLRELLFVEREVSNKLEKALETVLSDMQSGRFDEDAVRAALAEVAAIRATNTEGEQR